MQFLELTMMLRIVLMVMAVTIIAGACAQEPDLHLDFKNETPPSFSFSGRSVATKFEVQELPQSKPLSKIDPYSVKGEIIWIISTSSRLKAGNWPVVTYGELPIGFSQPIPKSGRPPKLTEDKVYIARLVGEDDHDTRFFFEIRNGKLVNVTDKVFGP
jgi:hypothetical protein